MITQIDLEHFKCFEELHLPLRQLTILSGTNASGKSSVLQSLVLLHQTAKDNEWSTRLLLNGSEICLGTVADVVDEGVGGRLFKIGLTDEVANYSWTFEGEHGQSMSAAVLSIKIGNDKRDKPPILSYLIPPETHGVMSDLLVSIEPTPMDWTKTSTI